MDLKYLETIHSNMVQRCFNKKDPSFRFYGGRGVRMSQRWLGKRGVANFVWDVLREIGPRPSGKTSSGLSLYNLDRYPDLEGDYRPGNVRWSLGVENQAHKRPRRKEAVPLFVNSTSALIEQRA